MRLWLEIANKHSHAASQLAEATKQLDMSVWPAPVVRFYLGQLTTEALSAAANSGDAKARTFQICELNFYTGEWLLAQGRKDDAISLFRLTAASTCQGDLVEYESAKAQLKTLAATQ